MIVAEMAIWREMSFYCKLSVHIIITWFMSISLFLAQCARTSGLALIKCQLKFELAW